MSPQLTNPYIGPRSFTETDRGRFYGREREARDIVDLIIANQTLLLYSPSGVGKSSLLNASVLPALRREGYEIWPVARIGSYFNPQGSLIGAIDNIYIFSALSGWETDPASLVQTTFQDYLAAKQPPLDQYGDQTLRIIVFDQFEELFTAFPQKWADRQGFFRQIGDTLGTDPYLRIIFVIREEYLAQLETFAYLIPGNLRTRVRLERLRAEDAKKALEGPILATGRHFEPGVVEALIDELRSFRTESSFGETTTTTGEFIEPVQLQIVAYQLLANLPVEVTAINLDKLREFGDVNESLTNFYEDAIQKVLHQIDISEIQLRNWFEYSLITEAGTRGIVYQGEFETAGLPNEAIRLLQDNYLIRSELRAGGTWLELIHDRFITPIREANQFFRAAQPPVFQNARLWEENGHDPQLLLQGHKLEEALRYIKSNNITIDPITQHFLAVSEQSQVKHEWELAQGHQIKSRRLLFIGLAIGLITGILGTLLIQALLN